MLEWASKVPDCQITFIHIINFISVLKHSQLGSQGIDYHAVDSRF